MKKTLLMAAAAAMAFSGCGNAPGYRVDAEIANLNGGKAVLTSFSFTGDGADRLDSVTFQGNRFSFKGSVAEPSESMIAIYDAEGRKSNIRLILENDAISVKADQQDMHKGWKDFEYNNPEVRGGKNNELSWTIQHLEDILAKDPRFTDYIAQLQQINRLMYTDRKAFQEKRKAFYAKHQELAAEFQKARKSTALELVRSHPDVEYAANYMRIICADLPFPVQEEVWNSFTPEVQQSEMAEFFRKEVENQRLLQPGQPARDFTLTDIHGNEFTLSSLKGRIIVLDFWASWCVPCRQSMPGLKEIYSTYKDKGLEIVGISMDDHAEAWKKAVEQDQTPWLHMIEDKSEKVGRGRAANLYSVPYYPSYFLIDSDFRMVGRFQKEELPAKIGALLR